MIDSSAEDLVQRAFDGTLEPGEQDALRELLDRDEDARGLHAALQRVSAALSAAGPVDPPAGLTESVLQAVRASASRPGRAPEPAPADRSPRRAAWKYAVALAAGLVLGALVFGVIGRESVGDSGLSATMGGRARRVADRKSFSNSDFAGQASAWRSPGGEVVVELSLARGTELEARLSFDEAAFAPAGFERDSGAPGQLSLAPGQARLTAGGPGVYRLRLEERSSGKALVRVEVSGGASRWNDELSPGQTVGSGE